MSTSQASASASASDERAGELHPLLVGVVVALACLLTVGWWTVLFLLMRSLVSAVF